MSLTTATNTHEDLEPLRVLLDMDGVLCRFEEDMLTRFRIKFPNEPFVRSEDRRTFYMYDEYEKLKPELRSKLDEVMETPGFFREMQEVQGAVSAVKEMSLINGVEIFICTTPLDYSHHCVAEKYDWVREHFGEKWTSRLILTHDKTMIQGDILIDDKHKITGSIKNPSWDHVIFSECHNRHLEMGSSQHSFVRRLENWTDESWKTLIADYQNKNVQPIDSHVN